ncbi:hypothetical protein TIFTF001_004568 [Ficus carica]|uniref:Uncharacterized protein n=1 Tax=Ficus carica TaxID=3494 RepID=A0AA87ZDF3_FICCA|nr:hypothetical protein TIFTF001_004568 [Ficus carica]
MAITVTKEEPKKCSSSFITLVTFMYRIPLCLSFLFLVYLWSSSTTIFSGKLLHFSVSSRKLNNLYCLSAGTQPNFEITIPIVQK